MNASDTREGSWDADGRVRQWKSGVLEVHVFVGSTPTSVTRECEEYEECTECEMQELENPFANLDQSLLLFGLFPPFKLFTLRSRSSSVPEARRFGRTEDRVQFPGGPFSTTRAGMFLGGD